MKLRKAEATLEDYRSYDTLHNLTPYSFEKRTKNRQEQAILMKDDVSFECYSEMIGNDSNFVHLFFENDEGSRIGYSMIEENLKSNKMEIKELIVMKEFQAQGLGTAFYQELEKKALEKGYSQIELSSGGMKGAIVFWEKVGFESKDNSNFIKKIKL